MSTLVCSPARTVRCLHHLVAVSFAICGFAAGASAQTTVTLSAPRTHVNADATIQGGAYGYVNFSDRPVLATKVSSPDYTRRIMLKFDTQNFIPANAVIQSAYLYLVLSKAENSEKRPLTAYYVTKSFGNSDVTWYTYRGGAWSTPGGDLGPSFGTTYVGNGVGSAQKFDLTRMVQRAVNGDFGSRYTRIALIDTGAATAGNYREFHSTRAANAALRPRLVITYGASTTSTGTSSTTSSAEPSTTPASGGSTVTLSTPGTHINADLYVQGGTSAWTDFSDNPVLASKVSSESYTRRILLKFDTQNYVPANAVIQSAQLYLTLSKAESSENRPLTAYHVSRSFVRGETTWKTFRNGQYWSRGGGDLGTSFGTTYVGNAVGAAYRFDLTKMVQAAVNGQFGSRYTRVALIDTGAATDGNYRAFHSTRASDASARPRLVITYTTSTSTSTSSSTSYTSTSSSPPTTSTSTSGTMLRVMQWNIHKTKGSDGLCNPDRTASVIVAQNPDVVSLNEVNFYSGSCAWSFDMGEKIQALLQQKTGVTWYRQHVNAGGVGNVLLSRIRPTASGSTQLSYTRGVAHMSIVVNGRTINLFSTHVEYFQSSWRPIQIKEAVRWMSGFAEPRIMLGDFNTWPGTSDYKLMADPYQDAWVAGQNAGTAWALNGSGATHGSSRFDYVFHSRVAALSLVKVRVPDTRVSGVWPSDHHPVIAEYRIN